MTDAEHRAADAVRLLQANGIAFRWCTPFHLKAGPVNFWPARGRVHVDGEAARRPGEGAAVFHKALTDLGLLRAAVRAPVQVVSGVPRTAAAQPVPRSVQAFQPLHQPHPDRRPPTPDLAQGEVTARELPGWITAEENGETMNADGSAGGRDVQVWVVWRCISPPVRQPAMPVDAPRKAVQASRLIGAGS